MTHICIYGQTLSGKSTLAKKLATEYKNQGIGVLVFDPVNDNSWTCDFKTNNFKEFLEYYWKSESCMVFIDEAGDVCGQYSDDAIRTATKGRHRGHLNHYISQRARLISPTIRDQCSRMFLFNSGYKDCQTHAEEWNAPELKDGTALKQGEFFHVERMGDVTKNRLF